MTQPAYLILSCPREKKLSEGERRRERKKEQEEEKEKEKGKRNRGRRGTAHGMLQAGLPLTVPKS